MITKLLPDQISRLWDVIKYAIEESLPPIAGEHPDKMNRLLSSMLTGTTEVWVSYTQPERKFESIIVTQQLYDNASNTKNLLIYCHYSYEVISPSSWKEGLETLLQYAKEIGCSNIVAYSANQRINELARRLGANTDYTFISIGVN